MLKALDVAARQRHRPSPARAFTTGGLISAIRRRQSASEIVAGPETKVPLTLVEYPAGYDAEAKRFFGLHMTRREILQ